MMPKFLSMSASVQIDIPKYDSHVCTYTHPENRSFIQSLVLMRSAMTLTSGDYLLGVLAASEGGNSFIDDCVTRKCGGEPEQADTACLLPN